MHRFRDVALDMSIWLPLLRFTPDGGVPLGQSS